MTYYLLIYSYSLICSFLVYERNLIVINNRVLAFLFCGFLIILAGCRYNISTDYWSYFKIFNSNLEEVRFEFLFKNLMTLCKNIFHSYNAFVFTVAFISLFVKGLYFSKLYNPFLAIFIYICIYFFDSDFNIIRQGLGIGFIYFAIEAGKKKEFVKFCFLVGMASAFHVSYLIILPFYFLCDKTVNLSIKKVFIVLLFLFIFRVLFFNNILRFIQQILRSSNNALVLQLVRYLGVEDFSINLSLLRRLFFICLYIYLFGTNNLDIYFILYFISFVLSLLLTGNEMFLHRLSLCFDIFSVPLFANKKISFTKKNIIGLIALIGSLTLLYFKPMSAVLPYQSYL